jgi:hypothetical protein
VVLDGPEDPAVIGPERSAVSVRIAADRMSARRGAARSVQSSSDQDSSFSAQRTMSGSCG